MKGAIIAIGGAAHPDGAALRGFFDRCHSSGEGACISILPTASQLEDAGVEYVAAFAKMGLRQPARILPVRCREDADRPEIIAALRQSTGIFMTGGNQSRLCEAITGTRLHQELLAAHQNGAAIAGTSAGTAALSAIMIADGKPGALPRGRIAQFCPGLGLVPDIIFDQHFRQRNRVGRLIYAVTSSPGLLGVGVDENTAAILEGDRLTVAGAGAVTIVDGQSITASNLADVKGNQAVAVSSIRLHILTQGCTFDLSSRKACIPQNDRIKIDMGLRPEINIPVSYTV